MGIARNVIKLFSNLIFWLSVIVLGAYAIAGLFGSKLYNVPTGSMEPNIHAGSLVVVKEETSYSDIEVGDVIVYKHPYKDMNVIHRVINITEEGIFTKGDANPVEDGICITEDMFIGKYLGGAAKLGRVFEFMSDHRTLCVIVIVAAHLLDGVMDIAFAKKKEKETTVE